MGGQLPALLTFNANVPGRSELLRGLRIACLLCATTASLGLCRPALAHPEGFSGLHVTITPTQVRAAMTLHTRDLGAWFPPGRYPDYVADVTKEMERTVGEIVELQIDGQALPVASVRAHLLEVGLIEIDVTCRLPDFSEPVELLVWSKHLIRMPRGHQQLLFVEDRREVPTGAEQGSMLREEVLTVELDAGAALLAPLRAAKTPVSPPAVSPPVDQDNDVQPARSAPAGETARRPKPSSASRERPSGIPFFLLGVEHILTGYDHLLFLAALLLTCTRFHEAATIITCFTVAHSITLALAALDIVRLPSGIVEPAIALSIVFVAVENLFGTPPLWRRAAITCFFGLIHGLGFAFVLQNMGLGTVPGGVVWPLVRFNLGVEAGQLCVASVVLPLLLAARRHERLAQRLAPAGSLLVALVGGYWLAARVVSQFVGG